MFTIGGGVVGVYTTAKVVVARLISVSAGKSQAANMPGAVSICHIKASSATANFVFAKSNFASDVNLQLAKLLDAIERSHDDIAVSIYVLFVNINDSKTSN
jgi:hypothetical protein